MKRRYVEKKRSPRLHSEHILRDRNNSPERGFMRAATDRLKINIIRFVRIRAGDIERRDRRFAAISHEKLPPGRWGKKKKRYSEEKIDRSADLANPSSGICKAAARHSRPSFHRSPSPCVKKFSLSLFSSI